MSTKPSKVRPPTALIQKDVEITSLFAFNLYPTCFANKNFDPDPCVWIEHPSAGSENAKRYMIRDGSDETYSNSKSYGIVRSGWCGVLLRTSIIEFQSVSNKLTE